MLEALLSSTKALSDGNRLRILLLLREGEICLCHVAEVLSLSPSTTSKHVSLLRHAGLVSARKEGRWRFFRLAGDAAPPHVPPCIRWVIEALETDATVLEDARRLRDLLGSASVGSCGRG